MIRLIDIKLTLSAPCLHSLWRLIFERELSVDDSWLQRDGTSGSGILNEGGILTKRSILAYRARRKRAVDLAHRLLYLDLLSRLRAISLNGDDRLNHHTIVAVFVQP